MWNDIEIFGGHYVYRYEDGELECATLSGEEVDQEIYESIEQQVQDNKRESITWVANWIGGE